MPYMDPDIFQRLTLLNQFTILSKIDPEGDVDWDAAATAVWRNWPIDMLPGVEALQSTARQPFTGKDREFVYDVLNLHEALQRAEDAGTVDAENGGARFDGFDGNSETSFLAYVRDLIDREGSFRHVRATTSSFNSHMPMTEVYGRMLEQWEAWGNPETLTAGQYIALLTARVHPANR